MTITLVQERPILAGEGALLLLYMGSEKRCGRA